MAMKKANNKNRRGCKPRVVNLNSSGKHASSTSENQGLKTDIEPKENLKRKWQQVPVNYGVDFDGFGGIEELTDYNISRGKRKFSKDDDSGDDLISTNNAKKKVKREKQERKTSKPAPNDAPVNGNGKFRLVNSPAFIRKVQRKAKPKKKPKKALMPHLEASTTETVPLIESGNEENTEEIDMSRWEDLFVPFPILEALKELKFTAPTPIQAYTLPSAIRDRMDILGAAETGSGKTLAFAIPILNGILQDKEKESQETSAEEHMENESDISEDEGISINENDSELENEISSEEENQDDDREGDDDNSSKHNEIQNSQSEDGELLRDVESLNVEGLFPDLPETSTPLKPLRALILTPTRELAIQVQRHIQAVAKYTNIYVAVIVGGMAPQKQKRILNKNPEIVVATPGRLWELIEEGNEHLNQVNHVKYLVIDEADRMVEKGHFDELRKVLDLIRNNKENRQNFIFSATLTMVHDTPKRLLLKKKKYKLNQKVKMDSIMTLVGMKEKPKVVDITKKFGTVDTLTEAKLFCNVDEKDAYLYYFFLTYPGRTLVFCNSIDCVRRLKNVLDPLNCHPLPLHSSMPQRQRLKNLDRFRNQPKALLLATDVAARGLDIPDVQHVIHYHVPKTAENYVHRSGRTARASNEGLSLMLLSPQEVVLYRKLCRTLNRDKDLPDFPTNHSIFASVQERVALARKLDVLSHRFKKKSSQNSWLLQAAEKMDIDIDDEDLSSEVKEISEQNRQDSTIIKGLTKQLNGLLGQSIAPRGMFTRYPTQTGKLNLPSVMSSNSAICNVGKATPWKEYEEIEKNVTQQPKKPKKNKKKFWKPKSKT